MAPQLNFRSMQKERQVGRVASRASVAPQDLPHELEDNRAIWLTTGRLHVDLAKFRTASSSSLDLPACYALDSRDLSCRSIIQAGPFGFAML